MNKEKREALCHIIQSYRNELERQYNNGIEPKYHEVDKHLKWIQNHIENNGK